MAKSIVVYDSIFGNTRKVAFAIAEGLATKSTTVEVKAVSELHLAAIDDLQLLVVGSPTRGFRATPSVMEWINVLPDKSLGTVQTAAFDTRIPEAKLKSNFILRLMGPLVKYAVDPIASALQAKGALTATRKNWFYVAESEGPLVDGELERARQWGKELL